MFSAYRLLLLNASVCPSWSLSREFVLEGFSFLLFSETTCIFWSLFWNTCTKNKNNLFFRLFFFTNLLQYLDSCRYDDIDSQFLLKNFRKDSFNYC